MRHWYGTVLAVTALAAGGCGKTSSEQREVKADGSSTVAPMSMVAAEMFMSGTPVSVTVGISGTGGGFKKFLDSNPRLRTDINGASRPISHKESETAEKLGIRYIELPIALDGIAVVVNRQNTFCDHLTTAELKRIWEPESRIDNWREVRAGFPDVPLKLYGPGTDSGTFDYFTEVINGREKASRSDYQMSEDDNTLVQGVMGDRGGLGYFGFSYYEANADKLKLLGIDAGSGEAVRPSVEAIRGGTYRPLSRPLFLYVSEAALSADPVAQFVEFYLTNIEKIAGHPKVGYVPLPAELNTAVRARVAKRITGSAYAGRGPTSAPADLTQLYLH